MRIIPAIDIIEGKCVRLTKGDYATKIVYNEDPLEVAQAFQDAGLKYLHLVDLDGAKQGKVINWKVLEKLANKVDLVIDYGGGMGSGEDVRVAFESGAAQVTGGSVAVKKPVGFTSWLTTYGSERIILGADSKDGKIAISGWQEGSELEVNSFIRSYVEKGIRYVISTDIAKDGMLEGPSFQLYENILKENESINLIASGGVSSIDDLIRLKELGLEGAIVGKAIYEGFIQLRDLRDLFD